MPRFFFDRRENGTLFPDEQGILLGDLAAAECELVRAAFDIARDGWNDGVHTVVIELRSAEGPLSSMKVLSELIQPGPSD